MADAKGGRVADTMVPAATSGFDDVPEPVLQYGGFWIRAAARVLDLIVQLAVAFVFGALLAFAFLIGGRLLGIPAADLLRYLKTASPAGLIASLLGAVVYEALFEGLHGSTLGKLAFGLVVLDQYGRPCGMRAAITRSLAYFVDALFFGLVAYASMRGSAWRQRFGDRWAHTVVVKRRSVPPQSLRSGGRFAWVLVVVLVAYGVITVLGQVIKI
jgi:uncharacterized RDD family membrane protein YckC